MFINDIMCGRKPIIEFHTPTTEATELQWEVTTFLVPTTSCNQSVSQPQVMDSSELIHIHYSASVDMVATVPEITIAT